jgi:hypothetical protein
VRLAARGLRDLDSGEQVIDDPAERAALRRQATRVYLKSLAAATVLTVAAFLL